MYYCRAFGKNKAMKKAYKNSCLWLGVISGLICGAAQVFYKFSLLMPLLLIPFFLGVIKSKSFKTYLFSVGSFLFFYYFVQFSFLLTVSRLIPFPKPFCHLAALLAVVLLTVSEGVTVLFAVFPAYFFKGGISRGVSAAFLFVLGEHLQEKTPFFAFPWSRLENAFAYCPSLIQTASLFGGSFTALIILLTSALLSAAISSRKNAGRAYFATVTSALVFLSNAALGQVILRLRHTDGKPVSCTIVQGSVKGEEKYGLSPEAAAESYMRLISENFRQGTELILLPETAVPDYLESSPVFGGFKSLSKKTGAVIVTGCFTRKDGKAHNSLAAFEPDGEVSESFDKRFLVPFGEYAPFFKDYFGFNELYPSDSSVPLEISLGTLGAAICAESVFSDVVSTQVRQGCDLILVSTNDSWFFETCGREVHFRHSIMRAVESGKYLLRSGNCGISAFITPSGEILSAELGQGESVLHKTVYLCPKPSLYAKLGDIIILPSLFVFGFGISKMIKSRKTDIK